MTSTVVVLGAGYAGAGAIQSLEAEVDDAEMLWISESAEHVVLHEAHRAIRDPDVRESITIPVDEIKDPETTFLQGEVTGVDTEDRLISLASGETVDYDYVIVALGSATAYYGIPGLETHAHTLKSLEDAVGIHDALTAAAESATAEDPAQILIGGAGLSGIQVAGEVAAYRDKHSANVEVTLIEALPEIYPPGGAKLTAALRRHLGAANVTILTDDPITEADGSQVYFEERESIPYDVFVWTGGIRGRTSMREVGVETEQGRLIADDTFQTSDDRVFALGDAALVAQGNDSAPPTAQAAWDAATVLGENVRREIDGQSLKSWSYDGKGTLISIGETSIAADIPYVPFAVFDSIPATILKKGAAARWIASITSWSRALRAWNDL